MGCAPPGAPGEYSETSERWLFNVTMITFVVFCVVFAGLGIPTMSALVQRHYDEKSKDSHEPRPVTLCQCCVSDNVRE